jgi:alkyl hydroperoxide reductase subunit F
VPLVQENVAKLERRTGTFIVSTDTDTYRARSIIIATGRRFKKLGIPGEADYLGKGLSECTVCDGPLFKGKTVAVIGGGRSGLFGTLFLLELAKKIYLIEQGPHLKTEGGLAWAAEKIRTAANVELMPNTKPLAVEGNRFVQRLLLSRKGRKSHLPVDGVFVEIGYVPNTEFVGSLVKRNARGEIIVDEECRTSVPGIFAAGDVTHLKEKQVVVSVGDGAKAALSAVLYLEGLKK